MADVKYTKDQRDAVASDGRNIIVSAAAGSGKTFVLVDRIISHLLKEEEAAWDISRLLVVTFTHAAAEEMSQRINKALSERVNEVREAPEPDEKLIRRMEKQLALLPSADISTMHSFCQKVIRQNFAKLDIDPKFRVADENELSLMKEDILAELLEEEFESGNELLAELADAYSNEKGDSFVAEAILKLYEFSQNQPRPEKWLQKIKASYISDDSMSLKDTIWFRSVIDEMKLQAAPLAILKEKLEELTPQLADSAQKVDGKEKYENAGKSALDSINAVLKALEAEDWNQICDALDKKYAAIPTNGVDDPGIKDSWKVAYTEARDITSKKLAELCLGSSEILMADIRQVSSIVSCLCDLTIAFAEDFKEAKAEKVLIDFNDMEHLALAALSEPDESGEGFVPSEYALRLQEHYEEIMIDEYQDTNEVQNAIMSLVAGEGNGNIFIVGDVKQSIYGFRSSVPELFIEKYRAYGDESDDATKLICMKKNFRSRSSVLAAVNIIFEQAMQPVLGVDYDKEAALYYGAENYSSRKNPSVELTIIDSDNGADDDSDTLDVQNLEEMKTFELEAEYIAQRLRKLYDQQMPIFELQKDADGKSVPGYRPVRWRDMAILLRSSSTSSEVLVEALTRYNIPVYADSADGYFSAMEIRIMLALLGVIDNVHQDIQLAAVLYSPIAGLNADELASLKLLNGEGDLYDALNMATSADSPLAEELKSRIEAFSSMLSGWRRQARYSSVPELIWQIFRDTGFYDYAGGLKGGLLRQANLRMLAAKAEAYEKTGYRGLFRFLRFIEKIRTQGTDLPTARTMGEAEDVVRIMTIHKSKGLEFPVVVAAQMGKAFNLRDASGMLQVHKDFGLGISLVDAEKSLSSKTFPQVALGSAIKMASRAEELRVLYVAMTRAKEKLILTGSMRNVLPSEGKSSLSKSERWLKEAQESNRIAGNRLAPHVLINAKCYLDWICPALINNGSDTAIAEVLCGNAADDEGITLYDSFENEKGETGSADWSIKVLTRSCLLAKEEPTGPAASNKVLKAVADNEALEVEDSPETEAAEQLIADLAEKYDYQGRDILPSKLSVSEIKQRFMLDESEDGELITQRGQQHQVTFDAPEFIKKDFSEGRGVLAGAEYGTVMHSVMQHVDLSGELSADGIQNQLEGMVHRGILLKGHAEAVKAEAVAAFFESEIGRRLLAAEKIWRELPFSRLMKAKERLYPDIDDESASIFSQGVIDLLFREKDGSLILVDYKTDKDTDEARVKDRYSIQLELYTEAIAAAMNGAQVAERYLYMLHDGKVIRC